MMSLMALYSRNHIPESGENAELTQFPEMFFYQAFVS